MRTHGGRVSLCLVIAVYAAFPQACADAAEAGAAEVTRSASSIRTDDGLLLSDWLLLAESRLGDEPESVLDEGLRLVERYPRTVELERFVAHVADKQVEKLFVQTADDARATLPQLDRILSVLPGHAAANSEAGRAHHYLGDYDKAAMYYEAALRESAPNSILRSNLESWSRLATRKEALVLAIGPIKERPLPPEHSLFETDIKAVLAQCIGEPTAGFDAEVKVEGTFSTGTSNVNVWRYRSLAKGLLEFEYVHQDMTTTGTSLFAPPFFGWTSTNGTWTSGTLTGSKMAIRTRTFDVACAAPLFPIRPGTRFSAKLKVEQHTKTTGDRDIAGSERTVAAQDNELEFEQLLSPSQLAEKLPNVRIQGPSAKSWRIYAAKYTSNVKYTKLDVPRHKKGYYTPTSTTQAGIFVEGPNIFVFTAYTAYEPGWQITISEM